MAHRYGGGSGRVRGGLIRMGDARVTRGWQDARGGSSGHPVRPRSPIAWRTSRMADAQIQHRSRRSLLAAVAGGAAALAAQAALPLTAAAANNDPVLVGTANSGTATTSLANSTPDVD